MMPKQTKYELPPFTWWLMHTNYPLHVQVQGVTFARELKLNHLIDFKPQLI